MGPQVPAMLQADLVVLLAMQWLSSQQYYSAALPKEAIVIPESVM